MNGKDNAPAGGTKGAAPAPSDIVSTISAEEVRAAVAEARERGLLGVILDALLDAADDLRPEAADVLVRISARWSPLPRLLAKLLALALRA